MRRRRLLAALLAAVLGSLAGTAASPAAMHTGPKGIALIEHFEGYFPTVYLDPVGVPTQCYGATGAELLTLPPIATLAQCKAQLRRSLRTRYEPHVRALGLPLNRHQFDATVSAVYNLGPGILARGRSFGDALRASCWRWCAADALRLYVFAGGRVFAGLVRRREAERKLFLTPVPVRFSRAERWLMRRELTPRVRHALRQQARRVQVAARRDGWHERDRARRFQALRARALTKETRCPRRSPAPCSRPRAVARPRRAAPPRRSVASSRSSRVSTNRA